MEGKARLSVFFPREMKMKRKRRRRRRRGRQQQKKTHPFRREQRGPRGVEPGLLELFHPLLGGHVAPDESVGRGLEREARMGLLLFFFSVSSSPFTFDKLRAGALELRALDLADRARVEVEPRDSGGALFPFFVVSATEGQPPGPGVHAGTQEHHLPDRRRHRTLFLCLLRPSSSSRGDLDAEDGVGPLPCPCRCWS